MVFLVQMSSEDIERRKRLETAVGDDDWSSVIDGQTKLTEQPKPDVEAPTATIIRYVAGNSPWHTVATWRPQYPDSTG